MMMRSFPETVQIMLGNNTGCSLSDLFHGLCLSILDTSSPTSIGETLTMWVPFRFSKIPYISYCIISNTSTSGQSPRIFPSLGWFFHHSFSRQPLVFQTLNLPKEVVTNLRLNHLFYFFQTVCTTYQVCFGFL